MLATITQNEDNCTSSFIENLKKHYYIYSQGAENKALLPYFVSLEL